MKVFFFLFASDFQVFDRIFQFIIVFVIKVSSIGPITLDITTRTTIPKEESFFLVFLYSGTGFSGVTSMDGSEGPRNRLYHQHGRERFLSKYQVNNWLRYQYKRRRNDEDNCIHSYQLNNWKLLYGISDRYWNRHTPNHPFRRWSLPPTTLVHLMLTNLLPTM